MEKIITVAFDIESEAYQAFNELKNGLTTANFVLSQASLIKNDQGHFIEKDCIDTGIETTDDTERGGLIGSLVGIIGGPLGMIIGGSIGALTGSIVDVGDSTKNDSVLAKVTEGIPEGYTAIVALVGEIVDGEFNKFFSKYSTFSSEEDAAVVAFEVEEAQRIQKEMEKDARRQLREEKKADYKQKIEAKREELKAKFRRD